MLHRLLQRLYPLQQPVHRADDCPTKEYDNRAEVRPQRSHQGDTSNPSMHLAGAGVPGKNVVGNCTQVFSRGRQALLLALHGIVSRRRP
jgi:hypothetical protein